MEEQKEREFSLEEKQSISFEILNDIRQGLANRIIKCNTRTDWSDDFKLNTIQSIVTDYKDYIDGLPFKPDITLLTTDELKLLGFERWSEDTGLMLVPIWVYNFIEPTNGIGVDGADVIIDDKLDPKASRFGGCMSCGIIPKDFIKDDTGGHYVSEDLKQLK